ncbi:hypothetical protein CFD26_106832 [Aspergillus turcosus]|uniref:Uncharacterized protein n=1 Tax=Aspergillus turcosus TaxID=1245748 RepID=A0A421D4E6_9EURO|nr:hypothetical protein CFD26_106832 [Aspergillus turcosus]
MGLISSDSLSNKKYNEEDCRTWSTNPQSPRRNHSLCVVRGIRYHPGFATELGGLLPQFTRALNARDIMSDYIPEMSGPDEFPYCIWHPETAKEETYWALASRYPQMKYLWEIYEAIMAADLRYNAMDDYKRTVFPKPVPGYLNADTAVRSYLDVKTKFRKPPSDSDSDEWGLFDNFLREPGIFDIAEDDRINEFTSEPPLCEISYAVRGIYHNTMFAKWWSIQLGEEPFPIEEAINARFIMNNDISRITPETKHLPYCTYYPSYPHVATCRELVRRVPFMKPAVARVCILCNYTDLWDELYADLDLNLKYLRDLEAKIPECGCYDFRADPSYRIVPRKCMFEHTSTYVINNLPDNAHAEIKTGVPYNGRGANMACVELSVSVLDEVKEIAIEELEEI